MPTLFDSYKQLIFPDNELKNELVKKIQKLNFSVNDFDEAYRILFENLKDEQVQQTLSYFLRKLAIAHLRNADTQFCSGFRDAYLASVMQ